MTKYHTRATGWNPTWTPAGVDYYSLDNNAAAITGGVTYQTAVPHPFAAHGFQYIKFTLTSGAKMILPAGNVDSSFPSQYPTTVRGARYFSCLFQLGAAPTATYPLFTLNISGTQTSIVNITTSRTITYSIGGVLPTNEVVSPPAITTGTNYQLEVWEVYRSSGGSALSKPHIIVRLIDLTTFAETILFESTKTGLPAVDSDWLDGAGGTFIGGTTTDATLVFYVGNYYQCLQNADDTLGVIRMEALDTTGLSVDGNSLITGWSTAGDFAKVDETGTAAPADADSAQDAGVTTTHNLQQLYTTPPPSIIAAGDLVHHPLLTGRFAYGGVLSKGSQILAQLYLSDATTATVAGGTTVNKATPVNYTPTGIYNAVGGSAWTLTDLNNLEIGCQMTTTSTNTMIGLIHNMSAMCVYTKSGEGTPAVKADRHSLPVRGLRAQLSQLGR